VLLQQQATQNTTKVFNAVATAGNTEHNKVFNAVATAGNTEHNKSV
jgi:hypothetical protein